jgi:hypothetical protein
MNLQATGLSQEALPALSLPPLDGATVYPDKPVSGNRQDGEWVTGRRQQSFAIVPERAGPLTIPATTLKWWNVVSDKMEVARIPAHTIDVLPAVGAPATPPAAAASTAAVTGDHTAATGSTDATASTPWRWVALASFGLWGLSLAVWWWRRRSGEAATPVAPARSSARSAQLAFLAAARGSDPAAQARGLLAWARVERPAIQHLGDLSAALDDPRQHAAIAALQRRHYAGAAVPEPDANLAEAFRRGFAWRAAGAAGKDSGLAPLYPFKLD